MVDVFISGTTTSNGTGAYTKTRIPALIKKNNVLVAFCEGRRIDNDFGDIEIIASRSTDNGATWTGTDCIRVLDNGSVTVGNPAPVLNSAGDIILLNITQAVSGAGTANNRVLNKSVSTDDGLTWSANTSLNSIQDPLWTWCATGPCHGIRKQYGTNKGRLIVPFNANIGSTYICGTFYSDDDGTTWARNTTYSTSGTVYQVNETSVTELADGTLVLISRNGGSGGDKVYFTSTNGGDTLSAPANANITSASAVQGSLLFADRHPSQLLYEATPENLSGSNRLDLRISVSSNGGTSWSQHRYINANAAYSDMVLLDGGNSIGILYEQGVSPQYQRIVFENIPITSIAQVGSATSANTGGTDQTSITVTKPTGVVEGNVLVGSIVSNNANCTPPSGWSEFRDAGVNPRTQLFWKLATSSEGANYTFTFTGTRPILGTITAWSNVDPVNPIAGLATATVDTTVLSEPATTPSVTNNTAVHGRTMYLRTAYDSNSTTAVTFSTAVSTAFEIADNSVATAFTNRGLGWYADTFDFMGNGATKTGIAITCNSTEEENIRNTFVLGALDPILGKDTGSGAEGTPSVAFTYSDTSSGTESTPRVAFTYTDTSSSTEANTIAAAITKTDTGSGLEAQTLAATYTNSDTGSSLESYSITVTTSSVDTGVSAEAHTLAVSLSDSDTTSAVETEDVLGSGGNDTIESTDSSTSLETSATSATVLTSDTGVATETHSIQVTFTASDTAIGVEVGQIRFTSSDTGSGVEGTPGFAAYLTHTDVSIGNDTWGDDFLSILATLPVYTDVGSGFDSGTPHDFNDNDVPTGVIVTTLSDSSLRITWTGASGAGSFDIERDGVIIANVEGNQYVDTGLTPRTTYTYRVRSVQTII